MKTNVQQAGSPFQATWSCISDIWFRDMPPRTMDELVSGKTGLLMVSRSAEVYHYSNRADFCGEGFATAEAAMAAADERIAAIALSVPRQLVIEQGLDPCVWQFCSMYCFVWFARIGNPETRIERHERDRWLAYCNGASVGITRSPAQAAELLLKVNCPTR